jgi:hypothetical protein
VAKIQKLIFCDNYLYCTANTPADTQPEAVITRQFPKMMVTDRLSELGSHKFAVRNHLMIEHAPSLLSGRPIERRHSACLAFG